jgi:cytochrome c oxidase accessory protein FixG
MQLAKELAAKAQLKDEESFRDKLATADKDGKRIWVYPKKPSGKLTAAREKVAYALLLVLFVLPFIKVGGEPVILLNIIHRKFIIFGLIFYPQDFHLFVIATIAAMIFIALFTVVYGRVFCGWVCPQTIFMEMVFRKIEYWIEGDWKDQKVLDRAEWTNKKILRKGSKHFIFWSISLIISATFLSYIIGVESLTQLLTGSLKDNLGTLAGLMVFSGIFYWVFAFFREQVCTAVCPYGRLQGVLLDKKSIIVAYDYKRGENRGLIRKGEDRKVAGKGDCLDCHHCVDVCPTGIDIRNGTQLECINCTACIDACNFMMEKVGQEKGLIRYSSENAIARGEIFRITPRIIGYSSVLLILVASLFTLTAFRSDVETTILRAPGMLFQEQPGKKISNLYTFKIINKTRENKELEFRLETIKGEISIVGKKEISVKREGMGEGSLFIMIPESEIHSVKTKVYVGVYSQGKLIERVKTTFMGPAQ